MFYASVRAHTCLHDATFPAAKLQMTSSSHHHLPSFGAVMFKMSVCNPERIDERSAIVNSVPSLRSTRIKKWRRLRDTPSVR
jgi:hypothetical protein